MVFVWIGLDEKERTKEAKRSLGTGGKTGRKLDRVVNEKHDGRKGSRKHASSPSAKPKTSKPEFRGDLKGRRTRPSWQSGSLGSDLLLERDVDLCEDCVGGVAHDRGRDSCNDPKDDRDAELL